MKKIFKPFVLLFVLIAIYVNVQSGILSKDSSVLSLLEVELLAFGESSGSQPYKTLPRDCMYSVDQIVGYRSDGTAIVQVIHYPGLQGACIGEPGPCNPWRCALR